MPDTTEIHATHCLKSRGLPCSCQLLCGEMAPSSTCTLQRAGRLRLCVILTLLLAFFSFNSALADSDNVDAAQTANSTSTAGNSHHKALVPVQGTDIGLFIVVAVALFIASGAGVGGGKAAAQVGTAVATLALSEAVVADASSRAG